jgi:DNA-binding Xre family transcriptional regulator
MNEKSKYPRHAPRIKFFLADRSINQRSLIEATGLSGSTISKAVNKGIAKRSVILLLSTVLKIEEATLKEYLITQENYEYYNGNKAD